MLRSYVDPFIADPPEEWECCEGAAGLALGHAEALTEYSTDFRKSLEYKQMRSLAQERGKLGF